MKRITNIILTSLSLLAFATISQAQSRAEKERLYYTDYGNGVGYSKTISSPDTNGVYTITLESFVEGNVTRKMQNAPADIVLVLDVSSSMDDNTSVVEGGSYSSETRNGGWRYRDISGNDLYYLYNNTDTLQVKRGTETQGRDTYYYLYIKENGNTHYLSESGITDTMPTNVTSERTAIYTGSLLRRRGGNTLTRIELLKKAVYNFIDEIDTNDLKDSTGALRPNGRLGNRISIITFGGDTTVVQDLVFLNASSVSSLKDKVEDLPRSSGTKPSLGAKAANNQLKNYVTPERKDTSSRTIVLFTDGEPHSDGDGAGTNYAAIGQTYYSKTTYDATVFTVGLFGSSGPSTGTKNFMNYMSSNYPNAVSYNNHGTGNDNGGYYFDVSEDESQLSKVFTDIAKASGGSGNTQMSSAVTSVDVVSASFMLPEGATKDSIKVYTAPVIGFMKAVDGQTDTTYSITVDGKDVTKHWLKFGTKIPVPDNTARYTKVVDGVEKSFDIDSLITVSLGASTGSTKNNMIKVNGFDYSANWCGEIRDDDDEHVSWHGHKLVIEIPIKMDSLAVGGPHVPTNAPGSGIYVNENDKEPLVRFTSPNVSLPVNLHINKQGLDKGESARFIIQRKTATTDWENVTSVFVTRHSDQESDAPITKIQGLPSTDSNENEFVYRIVEESSWSWSYTPDTESMLSTDIITNPFIFNNSKKTGIDTQIRHAESKATNVFKPGETNGHYDDSKNNNR